ncbi:MAG: hypothetical protein DRP42_07980 [Tenericutes bacterium]|nr:MAG: hypothetical protein DRP42_07980 [Mycoplasmatota bacterium]
MVEKCTYVVAVQAESLEEALEKASEMPPPLVDHSHKHKQVSSSGLGQTKTLSREDFIDKLPDLVLFRPSGGLGQTKTPDKS